MYVAASDYDQLAEGDVIECENCNAVLEVVTLEPLELLAVEGGEAMFSADCPRCGAANEVDEADEEVECAECGHRFKPDWTEVKDDYNDEDWRN
ncbi:MAG: paraquat-inducible protein A [Meiothermus sp.]|nr:paraquat-inducible protein A [Meiothermus sp.]